MFWDFWERLVDFFVNDIGTYYFSYLIQLVLYFALFYMMFKVLKVNKSERFVAMIVFFVILFGVSFAFSDTIASQTLIIIIFMIALIVFTMFHTEIKRTFLDSNIKKSKKEKVNATGVDFIIEETVRAVQNMSKKDIGALIVLSDENLPEGIIESGTVVNARITSQMIEAVFYPKAPLHDGAMIIEGDRIYAAGCFLPIVQNENLPQELGSRHRAALGVTIAANVTAIVVSEETGIISIVRNGAIVKKYADAMDIKKALKDFYWSDFN